jgi:hypothetical protein
MNHKSSSDEEGTRTTTTSIAIIAIVAALALLGAVVVTVVTTAPVAEAKSIVGQCATMLKNSSALHCHDFR